ncbi:MAG: hypothetical protein HY815_03535 [Candidatus Riflebacteria bacterium]|nr:hypothetical protein [Candidatus Riflebacteria bacterium]
MRIRVTLDTGLDHPAFYSAETDSITIAAQWFYARDPRTGGAVSAEQFRLHASHMIEHELAHMAFARKVGLAEYRRGSGALPLWVLEGVAEWAAGGVLSFTPGSEEIKALFEDGCMPPARMESAMRVTNGAKDPKANQQAYVQAYFMAKSLLSLRPEPARGLEQFVGFARDALRAGGSVEAALAGRYGLTPEQFDRRWRSLLETDVVRASRPVLSSFAASHSRPAVRGR